MPPIMPPKDLGFQWVTLDSVGREKAGFPLIILENRPLVDFPALSSGGDEEDRTPDLRIANATLSQLSYVPRTSILPRCPTPEQCDMRQAGKLNPQGALPGQIRD